jgi:hypothetical protein
MMIISRKRFDEEVAKRVCEELKRFEEDMWRDEREREQNRNMRDLEVRLIQVEKACGINNHSHQNVTARDI